MADSKHVRHINVNLEGLIVTLEHAADFRCPECVNPGPLAQPPTTASTADPSTNRPSVELGPPKGKDG